MVPRQRCFAEFLRAVFSASCMQHVSDLHLKFALGHSKCGSVAEKERKKKETTGQKPNGRHKK